MNKTEQGNGSSVRVNFTGALRLGVSLFVLAVVIFLPGNGGSAQEGPEDGSEDNSKEKVPLHQLREKFRENVSELRKLQEQKFQEAREREKEINRERDKLQKLRERTRSIKEDNAELKGTVSDLSKEVDALSKKVNDARRRDTRLRKIAEKLGRHLHEYLDRAVPYRIKTRKEELQEIRSHDNDDQSPVKKLELLWLFGLEEFQAARSSEMLNRRLVLPDGRKKHANLLRVGHRLLLFRTEDGSDAGMMVRKSEGEWTPDTMDSTGFSETVRNAMEMMKNRQSPKRVLLPLDLSRNQSPRKRKSE